MFRSLHRAQERDYRATLASACFAHAVRRRRRELVPLRRHDALLRGREGRRACARSATPRNAGSTRRSSSGCWSTGAGSRSRSAASRATRPRPRRSSRSSSSSRPGTTWPTWSWSPMPGCCPQRNLAELDEAELRFIVGSRVTKAPIDLESHFRWHGDAFTDGQIIDTITPKNRRTHRERPQAQAEPVWDPEQHPGSWRAVWAYSTQASGAGQQDPDRCRRTGPGRSSPVRRPPRPPRFVKTTNGDQVPRRGIAGTCPSAGRVEGIRHQHRCRADARRRGHRQLPRPVAASSSPSG